MPISLNESPATPAAGAGGSVSDIFLHLVTKRAGPVKGEASTDGHVDDIVVQSWTWGVAANTAIGSTAATARRSYRHLVVRKQIDSASTSLLAALATNDEVKDATLTLRKAGGEALDYFRLSLSNARIVDVDIEVSAHGVPLERVTLAFTKIEAEYKRQQTAGLGAGSTTFTDEILPA